MAHVCLRGLSWQLYQALMQDVGDGRIWRAAYSQGVLELRRPSYPNEEAKQILQDFVTTVVDELGIEARSLGALTLERKDLEKAIEPDSCFYIQSEALVRGKSDIRLPDDPPPDLAIESDHANSSLNKHNIYAALGVPEIWRYRRQQLEIYLLDGITYVRSPQSRVFPFLPVAEVPSLIERSREIGQRKAVKAFRARIQSLITESN
ncbi:MAG: Uma2 family endonuclease [Cyanobacteria bacterium J06648_16]